MPGPRLGLAAASALLLVGPAGARGPAAADPGEIVLDRNDPTIAATIAGVAATLAVRPDRGLTVAPAFAARLAVDWQRGDPLDVGRIAIQTRAATAAVTIGGVTGDRALLSFDGACCGAHDGRIGAADLPWRVVRIGRATPTAAEHRYPAETTTRDGLSIPWTIGTDRIRLILAPDNPETVATAAAAAILARVYAGHLEPAVRDVPVAYGVARPVREMRFDTPLPLLGFAIDHVAVRVADFAGAPGILAEADPGSPVPAQAGDIVVTHRPAVAQYRWAAVTIGRDLLDRCPQIAIYPRSGEIGLSCGPPG